LNTELKRPTTRERSWELTKNAQHDQQHNFKMTLPMINNSVKSGFEFELQVQQERRYKSLNKQRKTIDVKNSPLLNLNS